MPYYHAFIDGDLPKDLTFIDPVGYYEHVGEDGCPEPVSFGGFKISQIGESSFSKSPEATLLVGKDCDGECVIEIYVTDEEPDIDISDCGFDFGELEEVRYRRSVSIKPFKRVTMSESLVRQLLSCYGVCDNPEFYDQWCPPDDASLGFIKGKIREQMKEGKTVMEAVDYEELNRFLAEYSFGMPYEEYMELMEQWEKSSP